LVRCMRCACWELLVTLAYVGVLLMSSFRASKVLCSPALLSSSLVNSFCILFCICIMSSVFWFAYVFVVFAALASLAIICFSSLSHLQITLKSYSGEQNT